MFNLEDFKVSGDRPTSLSDFSYVSFEKSDN